MWNWRANKKFVYFSINKKIKVMTKEEIKLLRLLIKQELAVGIILNIKLLSILEFEDCVIRYN
jgi:hypothetical protein